MIIKKVNRYTRAGHIGKIIICPNCKNGVIVYHFSWFATRCGQCKIMTGKEDWYFLV